MSVSVLCLCKMVHHLSLNAQVFELPENVGIPVGGEDSEIFYRLEIHYNNPNRETGEYRFDIYFSMRDFMIDVSHGIYVV